ncbi:phage minor head protein [Epibacterium ulvae]|uniref:phage head morphogenesis protein n=1 Tax=Epibacterium ulvae TaxID=1156985 RepID=UPI00248F7A95|nr:phage minor head protein [Epibacterium ulvae]
MTEFSDRPEYSFDPGPPPEVRNYFRNKGLRPAFHWQDIEPEEHAVTFSVAKAMQIDVLQTIREELQKAIDEGIPFEQFKKDLEPKLRRLGWWGVKEQVDPLTGEVRKVQLGSPRRLKTIYRANLRSARAAGQWVRIQRTKRALPYLVYLIGPSKRHRPTHEAKNGLVLPVDDTFWQVWYPTNGWGCKCHVRQITRREAEEIGIGESPEIPMRDVFNQRTGEIKRVPVGIDPGWETNPGAFRQERMAEFLAERLDSADPAVARVAARDMASSWRVQRIYEGSSTGSAPIAMLPEELAKQLNSKTRVVQFSDYTAEKGRRTHPEVLPDSLPELDQMLREGTIYDQAKPGSLFVTERREDGVWVAIVKSTADRSELFLSTYYRASERYVRRNLTPDKILREGR